MTKDETKIGCVNHDCDKCKGQQEPVAVKHMMEWVEYLKRQSDHGQHLHIPSGMSAGTCWELAIELEQFISTAQPQRKPLTDEDIKRLWVSYRAAIPRYLCFARAIEAKLKEKNHG